MEKSRQFVFSFIYEEFGKVAIVLNRIYFSIKIRDNLDFKEPLGLDFLKY